MAHIDLGDNPGPGILGLLDYRPETAKPLCELAEVLLRSSNALSPGERELIAAYVSTLNECDFCASSHGAAAALQISGGQSTVEAVLQGSGESPLSQKMEALLMIASSIQVSGRSLSPSCIQRARVAGASDVEIHDTVLIAAAFCMYNRYVDGLATRVAAGSEDYSQMAGGLVAEGYLRKDSGRTNSNLSHSLPM